MRMRAKEYDKNVPIYQKRRAPHTKNEFLIDSLPSLFSLLSLSESTSTSYCLDRTVCPLPKPLPKTPFKPTFPTPPTFAPDGTPTKYQYMPSLHFLYQLIMDSDHDWKSPKFQAALSTMVKNTGDRLTDDGSNYADWEYRVKRLIETVTGRDNYLDDKTMYARDPRGDRIVFSIIDLSVPTD
ncbi:hypothetical protein CROQUDRAFT_97955, partial [Cronartium quercuum f. sp. fusiforme G11]